MVMKKVKILFSSVITIAFLIFAIIKIVSINTAYPSPKEDIHSLGETYSDSALNLTYKQGKIYSIDELNNQYQFETPSGLFDAFSPELVDGLHVYCITLTATNKSDAPIKVPAYIFNIEREDWANSINSDYYYLLNNTQSFSLNIDPGETITFTLPYLLPQEISSNLDLESSALNFKLFFSVYPIKRGFIL